MQISTAIEQFLVSVSAANLSAKTYRRYRDDLRELERFLLSRGVTALEAITADYLRGFMVHLIQRDNLTHPDRPLSAFSIEGKHRSIKRFFNYCVQEKYVSESPMVRVSRPKLPKRIVARLNEEQVECALQTIEQTKLPERNIAMLMLMVYSGLRRGEIVGLRVSDLDFQEGSAVVTGKGNKMRKVPVNVVTSAALSRWLVVREKRLSDRVFVNKWGGPIGGDAIQSIFQRLQKRLGLPRFYPHLMRHTFAVLYLKRVHDYKTLQQILGHARSSTTLDIYVDFDFEHLKAMHDQAFNRTA